MNDSISRQEAIDALNRCTEIYLNNLPPTIFKTDAVDTVRALSSAQSGWIPCSKRLPEREGRYVCTYTYDGKKDVLMFRFEDGDFLVPWYVETVTAWYKPLDPWEGEENGET